MANPIDAPALNPGSVNIKEVTLFKAGQEYPLKDFIVELSVFEDMFSNTMSATMILSDGLNLVGSLPITGGEIINISYTVP